MYTCIMLYIYIYIYTYTYVAGSVADAVVVIAAILATTIMISIVNIVITSISAVITATINHPGTTLHILRVYLICDHGKHRNAKRYNVGCNLFLFGGETKVTPKTGPFSKKQLTT